MKALLFRDLAQERWASMDVYADRLATGLSRIGAAGWEFRAEVIGEFVIPGLPVPSLYFNRAIRYPLYARRQYADVYHVLDISYGHLLHFIDPRRTVVTSHGGTPISWRRWNREGPAMRFFDWAFRGAIKAARIISVSEYAKRELVAHFDYDPEHVHVVYHGLDDAYRPLPESQREAVRAQILQTGERGLILHVGTCIERKNVTGLLHAFACLLRESGAPSRLLQVGGQFTPAQRAWIEAQRLDARITQIPRLPNAELVGLYSAADVFAFPSLYEGFGVPLIEAMACGVPIVCHEHELFHEVCVDAALFADATNASAIAGAMAQLMEDAALRNTLVGRGLARSREFTWERNARQTLAVYQQVAAEH